MDFIKIGNKYINPSAISWVSITKNGVYISLLSVEKSKSNGAGNVSAQAEVIWLKGIDAEKMIKYLERNSSAMP